MLDLLRTLRNALYDLSSIRVQGVAIDSFLHLSVACALVIVLRRFIGLRNSVYVTAGLTLLKEVVDVFAKSRLEYIRPPALDFVLDVGFSAAGIGLAVWLLRYRPLVADGTVGSADKPAAVGSGVSRMCGIGMALLCLSMLLQGVYVLESKLPLIAVVALTVVCYLGSKGRPDALLFLLVGLGPLINLPGFTSSPYMYNVEAALLCYFSIWFIANNRRVMLDSIALKLYALFFLTLLAGTLAQWLGGDMVSQLRLLRGFFLGLCLALFLTSTRQALARHTVLLLRCMLIAGFCTVVWGLLEMLLAAGGNLQFRHEPRALFSGSASLAIYLCIVIPVAVANRAALGRVFGWLAISVVLGGFLLLLATRSRIALLALLFSAGLYLLVALVRKRADAARLALWTLGFVLAALGAGSVVVYKTLDTSAMQLRDLPGLLQDLNRLGETVLRSRLSAWSHGVDQVVSSPLVGNGAIDNVYNVYLQLAGSFGIVALLAFGLLVSYCLWPRPTAGGGTVTGQTDARGLLWSMVALLVVSLAESTLGNQLAYLVWTVLLLVGFRYQMQPPADPPGPEPAERRTANPATIPVGHVVPDWDNHMSCSLR